MPIPRKGGVPPDTGDGDPENLGAVFAKLGKNLVIERHLIAAHWTPVSRIKDKDDRVSSQLTQVKHLVGCGVEREVGGACAGTKNRRGVCGGCGLCHSCLLWSRSAIIGRPKTRLWLIYSSSVADNAHRW